MAIEKCKVGCKLMFGTGYKVLFTIAAIGEVGNVKFL